MTKNREQYVSEDKQSILTKVIFEIIDVLITKNNKRFSEMFKLCSAVFYKNLFISN